MLAGLSYEQPSSRETIISYGPRGGRYIQTGGGRKRYIGGSPSYRGFTFMTKAVFKLLTERFFAPIFERLKHNLTSIQVIFDESNELNSNGNENIVVIYSINEDTDPQSSLFFLNTILILQAAYVESLPEKERAKKATAVELNCHQAALQMATNISQRLVNAVID